MPYKQIQDVEFRQYLGSQPPTIAGWNCLEGQPRSVDLEGGLSFDICDALWMVGRQLQFRELRGESAASPVSAKIKYSSRRIDRVRLGDRPIEPYDDSLPLEVRAEREHPPLNLRFALEAGRLWVKYLARAVAGAALSRDPFDDFLAAFPIVLPAESPGAAELHAHQTVLELYSLAAGRAIHGAALYAAARAFREGAGPDPLDALALAPSPADRLALGDLIEAWFRAMRARYTLDQHSEGGAWRPEALGYSLSCSAPGFDGGARIVLAAKDYRRGHLDWYSFDIGGADDPAAAPLPDSGEDPPVETEVEEFVPSLAQFAGMPALRLWEFENRKTNFGRITAYTTDLARLIFAEYGLAFGNDWFLFPLETEAGRILQIDGLVVTDTFGERVWVPAFGQELRPAVGALGHLCQCERGQRQSGQPPPVGRQLDRHPPAKRAAGGGGSDPRRDRQHGLRHRKPDHAGRWAAG